MPFLTLQQNANFDAARHKRSKADSQVRLAAVFLRKKGCYRGTKWEQRCTSTISIRNSFLRGKVGWCCCCCKCSNVCRKSTSSSRTIKKKIEEAPMFAYKRNWSPSTNLSIADIRNDVAKIVNVIQKETPLVHHLTNNVNLLLLLCLIS